MTKLKRPRHLHTAIIILVILGIIFVSGIAVLKNFTTDIAPIPVLLTVPAVVGDKNDLHCVRHTTIAYPEHGSDRGTITDTFTVLIPSSETLELAVIYPESVTAGGVYSTEADCKVLINGKTCTQYWPVEKAEGVTDEAMLCVEDGTYFHNVFPEGVQPFPEATDNNQGGKIRYFAAAVKLEQEKELTIEVQYSLNMTTTIYFRSAFGQMICDRHTVQISNAETMSIHQNLTDSKIHSTMELELDPTRKDYEINASRWLYRYH